MLKFSIDFDGVITDCRALPLRGVHLRTFFWSPLSIAYFPIRQGVRQAVGLLKHFGTVQITTARPVAHLETIRNWLQHHAPELAALPMVSSEGRSKGEFLGDEFSIHIDDRYGHSVDGSACRQIVWDQQSIQELLIQLVGILNEDLRRHGVRVSALALASLTPTFAVHRREVTSKLKMLAGPSEAVAYASFHAMATSVAGDKVKIPELHSVDGLTICTEFVLGKMASEVPHLRHASLSPLARFMAKFHEQHEFCTCAVDQYNICHEHLSQTAVVVDMCDNVRAAPLMDVIWSEQLLCDTDAERMQFVNAYLESRPSFRFNRTNVVDALADFYSWLHHILCRGAIWNDNYPVGLSRSYAISTLRARPPINSQLFAWL